MTDKEKKYLEKEMRKHPNRCGLCNNGIRYTRNGIGVDDVEKSYCDCWQGIIRHMREKDSL